MIRSIYNLQSTPRAIVLSLALLAATGFLAGCSSKSRINVPTTSSAEGDQVALAARVKTALLNDPIVGLRRIDVHVTGTDVRLAGRVATAAERDRALVLARAVPGVGSVTSELEIIRSPDHEITRSPDHQITKST